MSKMRKGLAPKVREICNNIIHVKSPNYRELKRTWMRFEEAYENPVYKISKFRRGFTKRDILKWWKTTGEGKTQPYYFTAFNIPSYILGYFYKGMFDPLEPREKVLLEALKPIYRKRKKFYVIGTVETPDPDELRHEIAHGLYYVSRKYRAAATRIMVGLDADVKAKIDGYLHKEAGYGRHVLADERHASILADDKGPIEKMGVKFKSIVPARAALNRLYDKTFREMRCRKDK